MLDERYKHFLTLANNLALLLSAEELAILQTPIESEMPEMRGCVHDDREIGEQTKIALQGAA